FGKPGAVTGWNFLVGKEPSIKLLADAVGFGYRKVEGRDEYSHPPMIVVLTADGKISRYFYGFQYPSDLLKTGLTEAGEGKVGTYVEQVLVALCYHYDEYAGKYSWSYMKLMQGGALLTMLVVFSFLGSRWIKDAKAARRDGPTPPPVPHS
ncbi:MAG: electron transport protein SCO1/SenC, partial [Phycisphaerales bacterium]|nr:electron transport protein SCO1/SenC [Phycisphaerales bacterium]